MSATNFIISSETDFNSAMTSIAGGSSAYTVTLTNGFTLNADPLAVNLGAGGSLTIDGGGVIIDGANSFRGLFVYAGNVTIRNLRLSHTHAQGGDGGYGSGYARYASTGSTDVLGNGGGGGAGLGGSIFVASGGTVTVSNVSMLASSAFGGNGGGYSDGGVSTYGGFSGGGGGMGGRGGSGSGTAATSGGGGGVGSTAAGGSSGGAGTGIIPGALAGGEGYNGTLNTAGGSGGGGGGYDGGGGGVGGGGVPSAGYATGAGGFGGGGGGGAYYVVHDPSHYRGNGGNGGFGGGGGGGILVVKGGTNVAIRPSGTGEFGGGGGGGFGLGSNSNGGFGAGNGGIGNGGGGGGLGAGADVFVQQGGRLILQAGLLGAGTVQGGARGGAGQAGSGFGTGLFIQGNQTITLAPPTGQTLIISGGIADQTGSGGTMSNAGAGSIAIAGTAAGGGGTVTFNGVAANRYIGPTTIGAGATLEIGATTTAGSGDIVLAAGTGTTLRLDGTAALPNSIDGLVGFGTLDLAGLPFVVAGTASVALSTLVVTQGVNSETFDVSGVPAGAVFNVGADSHSGTAVSLACFAQGTRIATEAGPVAVEQLRMGDRVHSAFGGLAPVVWIGHRRVNCRRHLRPQEVWPVRVRIGAFGDGMPYRDLWLSPDHAVFADAVLVPIRYLINGASIAQVPVDEVTYWHVELPAHDVLLAEGLPAESYLDTGNRGAFENGGVAPAHLHPDFALKIWESKSCTELVVNGPKLEVVMRSVFARVQALGYQITSDPDLGIMVDGRHLSAEVCGKTWLVSLPPDVRSVRLLSHDWVPAHVLPNNDVTRSLGVAIANVRLDGRKLSLNDPRLCSGWHAPEPQWLWTDGDAELVLASVRKLAFDVVITGRYWKPPAELDKAWVNYRRRSRRFEAGIPAYEVG